MRSQRNPAASRLSPRGNPPRARPAFHVPFTDHGHEPRVGPSRRSPMLRQLAATLASVALLAPLGCGGGKQTTRTPDPLVQAPAPAPTPTPTPMPDGTGPTGDP